MKEYFIDILNNISNAKYNNIIRNIQEPNKLNQLIIEFLNNIELIDDNKIEPLLKIILNIIIYLNGNINTEYTKKLYNKFVELNNKNIILLDSFIELFDEQRKTRLLYLSLVYQFIKCFKNIFPVIKQYINKNKLETDDIDNINKIIIDDIYRYYQSIFDLNYNKIYFKRITDCNNDITKNIHSDEMIKRMLKLCKIFGVQTLHKLKINIITVSDFKNFNYLERVQYFRIFYIRVNSLFKLYSKYYDMLLDINNKILLLVKIDPLDYIDDLEDSTSSFLLSDENIDISLFIKENNSMDTPFAIVEDMVDTPFVSLKEESTEDMADTPFVSLKEDKPNELENESKSEINTTESDENSSDSDENKYDFFVKS